MTPRECAHCHRFTEPEWIAYSEYAQADICLRCWERLPAPDLRILGLNLNVPRCQCGEPLGGRYWHEGKRVCWKCTGIVEPPPPKYTDTPYALFHRKVCRNWEKATGVKPFLTCDGTGRMSGPCPVCQGVTVVARVVDGARPELDVDDCDTGHAFPKQPTDLDYYSDWGEAGRGCGAKAIAQVLVT
jgi:hypothetical protein